MKKAGWLQSVSLAHLLTFHAVAARHLKMSLASNTLSVASYLQQHASGQV